MSGHVRRESSLLYMDKASRETRKEGRKTREGQKTREVGRTGDGKKFATISGVDLERKIVNPPAPPISMLYGMLAK